MHNVHHPVTQNEASETRLTNNSRNSIGH